MIHTEKIKLPASWASALINDDTNGLEFKGEVELCRWRLDNPHLRPIDAQDDAELAMFEGLLREVCTYTCEVIFTRKSGELEYLIYPATIVEKPLDWQVKGLSKTATGFGKMIPTTKMALLNGKFYRIYCTIYSNAGTCWINFQGRKVIID